MDIFDFVMDYFKDAFSTPVQIVGQVIGFVAVFLSVFTFMFVNRKLILGTKLITDVLWVFSFLFCGATSGALTNVVSSIREGVCYFKRKSWNKMWYIPAVFIAFYVGSAALTWNGAISLLPMIASTASVIGMWSQKPINTKLWCLPALVLWLLYSTMTYSVMAALSNVLSIVSVVVGLIREFTYKKKVTNKIV